MSEPNPNYELQRIGDSLETIIEKLGDVNDTIDALRWQLVKDAEKRAQLQREANDIRRRVL